MKAVLISIQPKWCELIASGKKTIEVRKSAPKLETPFKCYIYQTKKKWIYRLLEKLGLYRGKVIGEFVCDKIDDLRFVPKKYFGKPAGTFEKLICEQSCLSVDEIKSYAKGKAVYGWHISDLKIYDKPKELGEFSREIGRDEKYTAFTKLTRPPQSWCYVEEL